MVDETSLTGQKRRLGGGKWVLLHAMLHQWCIAVAVRGAKPYNTGLSRRTRLSSFPAKPIRATQRFLRLQE
jgi:hypothetical protein